MKTIHIYGLILISILTISCRRVVREPRQRISPPIGNVISNNLQEDVPTGNDDVNILAGRFELASIEEDRPQQIIEHIGYTVSYNPDWNIPNWVAYEITCEEANGVVTRESKFFPDPLVNGDAVVTQDYTNSGYDRGHMAPAGDMKWSEQAMHESCYMTNICPQNKNLNKGDWKELEELVRKLACQYGNVFVCCGPIVESEHLSIGNEHIIAVPSAFFKVLLIEKGKSFSAIAFMMPNHAGNKPLENYVYTVDEIEKVTGIDFFEGLPEDIEQNVENKYNLKDWL